MKTVDSKVFYGTYHGHPVANLREIHSSMKIHGKKSLIWLVGDSSLDNKYWILEDRAAAVNGYELVLNPPISVRDVAYWINLLCKDSERACLNASVEESTLVHSGRSTGVLNLEQDRFVRETISENDFLVVSVGGNDIVLRPTLKTVMSVAWMAKFSSKDSIRRGDAWGFKHMVSIFKDGIETYVNALLTQNKPKTVAVCCIYFPDEAAQEGWSERALSLLGYNHDPTQVQTLIESVYRHAIQKISIPGTKIVGVPMFSVLDGKDTSDYVQRVEPSGKGGKKIADLILSLL